MNISNYKKQIRFLSAIIIIILLGGCESNFTDLNTPKTKLPVSNINSNQLGQLFADAEFNSISGRYHYELEGFLYETNYARITSQGSDPSRFKPVASWIDLTWNRHDWKKSTVNIKLLLKYTKEHDMPVRHAITQIIAVPTWEELTDTYGPVPFSQFGNGKVNVAFDSQKSIYHSLFALLDSATTVLSKHKDATPFGENDIIYGGNVRKWITYANSLRLKMAIRIVYAEPEFARKQAEMAVKAGVITDNSGDALIATTPNNLNYLTTWTYLHYFSMSATQESILKGFHDPRMKAFWNQGGGRTGGNKGYHGLRVGLPTSVWGNISDDAGYSFVSDRFLPLADGGTNPPNTLMTACQVYLSRAEGALRGWDMGGSAKEFYNDGVRASLKYWTDASNKEIENYLTSNNTPVAVNSEKISGVNYHTPPESDITSKFETNADFETKLEQIITQKWLDEFIQPVDAWAERRRTGYPRGYAIIESDNPNLKTTDYIGRLIYPPSAFDNNNAAVTEAMNKYLDGKNVMKTRLWWDQKSLSKYPDLSNTVVH